MALRQNPKFSKERQYILKTCQSVLPLILVEILIDCRKNIF